MAFSDLAGESSAGWTEEQVPPFSRTPFRGIGFRKDPEPEDDDPLPARAFERRVRIPHEEEG